MAEPFSPTIIDVTLLADIVASGATYYHPTLHLAESASTQPFSKRTVLTDLVECIFPGYAEVTGVPWNAPYVDVGNVARVDLADVTFIATGAPTSSQTVVGWYLTDSAGTTLLLVGALDTPVPITKHYDGLTVDATFGWGD